MQKYGVTVEYGASGQIVKHHYPYFDKDTGTQTGTKSRIVDNKSFYASGTFDNVIVWSASVQEVAVSTSQL